MRRVEHLGSHLKPHTKSVVLANILYASPAWWGFANSSDKDRLEAFLRRCTRLQLYRNAIQQ